MAKDKKPSSILQQIKISDEPITTEKYHHDNKKVKKNKDMDQMLYFQITLSTVLQKTLHLILQIDGFCKQTLKQYSNNNLRVEKPGLHIPENFKCISVSFTAAKLVSNILPNMIRDSQMLCTDENWFHQGPSTIAQIQTEKLD